MKTVIEYNAVTGAIRRLSTQSDQFADETLAAPKPGEATMEIGPSGFGGNYSIEDLYVDTAVSELRLRESINPTVTTTTGEATISNLPDPCTVIWEGQEGVATGGSATITFDEPGTKYLILRADPQYLDHELEVEIP